ncbi:MAG: ferrous iron transport protein A [Breznakia sp.]
MTLDEIKPGKTVVVLSVNGQGPIRRRLFDMGITPKTKILVRKVAPLADPMEVSVRNYELSLRKSEAQQIKVEVCEG